MKVLYIGHYKEFGGWAEAAKNYILALDSVGVDVVCRNVTLTKDREISGRLKELEEKDTDGCTVCIQHVLPHHLCGTSKFDKNIAFLASESHRIKHHSWIEFLNQMDDVWVPNKQSKENLTWDLSVFRWGTSPKVSVVPHTFNTDKYKKDYSHVNLNLGSEFDNKFVFYYIGDINDRKNIETIFTCFHSEFDVSEPVELVIKANKFGHSPDQVYELLTNLSTKVKKSLRMYNSVTGQRSDRLEKYKRDIIIPYKITDEEICALHQKLDCFISPSHGEAWSIPAFDAMAFGSTPICSSFGGPRDFIVDSDRSTGTLVNGVYSTCKCSDSAFPDLFTGREYWFTPCEMEIRTAMRQYYEKSIESTFSNTLENKSAGLTRAEEFSYSNIGKRMEVLINE